jgi:hypothetical protein
VTVKRKMTTLKKLFRAALVTNNMFWFLLGRLQFLHFRRNVSMIMRSLSLLPRYVGCCSLLGKWKYALFVDAVWMRSRQIYLIGGRRVAFG